MLVAVFFATAMFLSNHTGDVRPPLETERVISIWRDYVNGLLRTPSVDTVPDWMRADDDED